MNRTRKQNYKDHRLIQRAHVKTISKNLINNIDKRPVWRRIQQGGGKTESVAIGDYVFLYDIENKSSIISFSEKEGICFHITFDIPTKEIGIDISFYSSCSKTKPLEKGSVVLIILQAILKIIFSRKEINKYNKILITDNSSIECKSYIDGSFVEIRLMDMYYVCTGCTWYSSLAPIFIRDEDDDIKFEKERQMIVGDSALSFNEFLEKLPEEPKKHLEEILKEYTLSIDVSKPGTASFILNEIRKARKHCVIFKMYLSDFLRAFKTESLFGKPWIIALENGKVLAPEINTCMKESGYIFPKEMLKIIPNDSYNLVKKSLQKPKITRPYFSRQINKIVFVKE